ncbi:MAG: DNA polymerase III subunit gamma/tau [Bacillota bacterium]
MEYVSLYRRWRPQKFSEVVGQRHVVLTLQRAITQGRVGHAYLFAGPRGTGKTTVARILAKALNCRRGPAPEPCLECDICEAIAAGTCLDVIEMDAASNRGVDEIRHLRENVGLAPAQGRTRVYIVDEVHMLTTEAFNALLKTLEEPPRHVLFVLATTEAHRLPLTITSRCQRFEFRRLDTREMVERLREVARQEGIPASEDALGAVARYAEGSLRDAISLLDQLMAYSTTGITQETVWAVLGRAPLDLVREMGRALAEGNAVLALDLVEQASARGLDMRQVLRDVAAYLRDLSVLATCGDRASLLYLPPGEAGRAREEAGRFSPGRLWELATALAQAEGEVRWTSQPRLALELALLRLVADRAQPAPQPAPHPEPVVATSPRAAGATSPAPTAPAAAPPPAATAPLTGGSGVEPPPAAPQREVQGDDTGAVPPQEVWEKVLAVLNRARGRSKLAAACLQEGTPLGLEGKRFLVGFSPQFAYHREQLEHGYRDLVEQALAKVLGHECRLVCRELTDRAAAGPRGEAPGGDLPGRGVADRGIPDGGVAVGVAAGRDAGGGPDGAGRGAGGAEGCAGPRSEPELDEVVKRAWREWGGYILDLEGEGAR